MATDKVQCCLELKLEAEFGTNFLLYQPFRQLLQLNILSKLYGFDNHFLYLVTMEREETLKQRLHHYYPRYINDLINTDLVKTLSWEMIRDWLDDDGLKQYPILEKLRLRLNEHYILPSKALERDKRREKIKVPQFILDNYHIRPTGAGEILELPGLTTIGFYPAEITVGLNRLPSDMHNKWVTQFERAGFRATPKQSYWSLKFDGDIPKTVDYLLREFLDDICS